MVSRRLLIAGITALILAGAGFLVVRNAPPFGLAASAVPTEAGDRIDMLEARLEKQERRFADLEALLAVRRLTPEQRRDRMEARQRRIERLSDPVHLAQERQKDLDTYSRMFSSELVDKVWASQTEVFIRDVIDASVADSGVPTHDRKIECRSSQCRIELGLMAGASPDELMQPMLINLAETLPDARIVLVPSADGTSTRMHVFASKAPTLSRTSGFDG